MLATRTSLTDLGSQYPRPEFRPAASSANTGRRPDCGWA
jgi:hypothetical protein